MNAASATAGSEQPLIVIGAGRSGTTMTRETLMQHRDVAGFEYEMNYLWRFGNTGLSHDLLRPEEHLSDEISAHIKAEFQAERERQGRPRILDKTVANVMRPKFIQAVFPGARFLHVIRDGRAVTASAMKRWAAPQPAGYFASKAKTIPLRSLPAVAFRYAKNAVKAKMRGRQYRQSWGPRWPDMDKDVRKRSLAEVCARQWRVSVAAAQQQQSELLPGSYLEMRYEDLVREPVAGFDRIRTFFDLPEDDAYNLWASTRIDGGRMDKWRDDLSAEELEAVEQELGALLVELGYA